MLGPRVGREGASERASGSQIASSSSDCWVENYRSRAEEWKRQPTASGRGPRLGSANGRAAIGRARSQICISEDHRGRCISPTLHNCKLSIHGRSNLTKRAKGSPAHVYICTAGLRHTCYCVECSLVGLMYSRGQKATCQSPLVFKVSLMCEVIKCPVTCIL